MEETNVKLFTRARCYCNELPHMCGFCKREDAVSLYWLNSVLSDKALLKKANTPDGFIFYVSGLGPFSADRAIYNAASLIPLWSLEDPSFSRRLWEAIQ